MSLNNQFKADPNVIYTELDENEGVLLHLHSKRYYSLNETGNRIWQEFQSGQSMDNISKSLEEEYDIADASGYVKDFLETLRKEGLVTHG